jgi:hypothetical protein
MQACVSSAIDEGVQQAPDNPRQKWRRIAADKQSGQSWLDRCWGSLWLKAKPSENDRLKTVTYQRVLTDAPTTVIGECCSRLSMLEGFSGRAEQASV